MGRIRHCQYSVADAALKVFFTAPRHASAVYAVVACPSVRPSIRPSQAGIVSKRLDESSYSFSHGGFLPPIPHWLVRKFRLSPKVRVLPYETLSQTPDLKSFVTAVDRVVNKARRRRRSSLLTTPIRQSTSRGCLLQVNQL